MESSWELANRVVEERLRANAAEQRAEDLAAKLAAAEEENALHRRHRQEISIAMGEAGVPGGTTLHGGVLYLRERAEAAESKLAAAEQLVADLVKQKHEPWEYYGVNDDERCAFCGQARDACEHPAGDHLPDCAWIRATEDR